MTAKINISKEKLSSLLDKGMSHLQIANHLNVSKVTIDRRTIEYGLISDFWVKDKPKAEDILPLIHKNKSNREIADFFKMRPSTFLRHCEKLKSSGDLPYIHPTEWREFLNKKGLAYCTWFEEVLPLDQFYIKPNGKPSSKCKKGHLLRKRKFKKELVDMFGGKCDTCGYNDCIDALVFHHEDPRKKEIDISKLSSLGEKAKKELAKCRLMCSNCHIELHHKLKSILR